MIGDRRRKRIEPYLDRLYGYAVGLCQDRERARELVQDCALRALGSRREPRDEPAYRAWLFRILRNLYIDSERRHRPLPLEGGDGPTEQRASLDWHGSERMIDVLTVKLALAKLSPPHREILALVDISGLSYAEAAETLDVPTGTVMSRLARARQALLELIQENKVTPLPIQQREQGR